MFLFDFNKSAAENNKLICNNISIKDKELEIIKNYGITTEDDEYTKLSCFKSLYNTDFYLRCFHSTKVKNIEILNQGLKIPDKDSLTQLCADYLYDLGIVDRINIEGDNLDSIFFNNIIKDVIINDDIYRYGSRTIVANILDKYPNLQSKLEKRWQPIVLETKIPLSYFDDEERKRHCINILKFITQNLFVESIGCTYISKNLSAEYYIKKYVGINEIEKYLK